jgi:hypothetical protein
VATGALSGASFLSDGVTSTASMVAGEAQRVRVPTRWLPSHGARSVRRGFLVKR